MKEGRRCQFPERVLRQKTALAVRTAIIQPEERKASQRRCDEEGGGTLHATRMANACEMPKLTPYAPA